MTGRQSTTEPAAVLLVEPAVETARSMRDGLSGHGSPETVHAITDEDDALEFLHQRGEYADAPRPCLVVLRFELPESGGAGSAVLEAMADEPALARIPAVVTTGSATEAAVCEAYRLGANAVVPMPTDPDSLAEAMDLVRKFWLSTVRLPNRDDRR